MVLKTLKDLKDFQYIDNVKIVSKNKNGDMKELLSEIINGNLSNVESYEIELKNRSVDIQTLRKSAIEWIKELRDESGFRLIDNEDTMLCGEDGNGEHCCDEGAIRWIKHFFNINEEDLNG